MCNGINPNNCRVCLSKKGEVRRERGKKKLYFFSLPSGKQLLFWGRDVSFRKAKGTGVNGCYPCEIKRGCNLVSKVSSSRIYK